ncbi:MAG: hypothetical protein Q9168_000497 [Polycauliona sp. 1 TL-2023]
MAISGRFNLVGPQLYTLWQEALTTGYVLKQAFSIAPPPQPAVNTTDDETAQHESLPTPQDSTFVDTTAEMNQIEASTQVDKATQTAVDPIASVPTADGHGVTTTLLIQGEQAQSSRDSLSGNSVRSDDTPASYANAATQIGKPSPQTDRTSDFTGSQLEDGFDTDPDCSEALPFGPPSSSRPASLTNGEPDNDDGQPIIVNGPTQVIVASHDNQDCFALLVTTEMIEYMNNITEETRKRDRLRPKLADVDKEVGFARAGIDYCEKLLDKAESDEEIAELRGDIERYRSTLPEDEKRLKALERRMGYIQANLTYSNDLARSLVRQALGDAGLLQISEEHDWEAKDDDSSQATQSQTEAAEHGAYSAWSDDVSEISIDELAKRAAKEEVQVKYEEFLEAERVFDARNEEYPHQKQLLQERLLENSDHPRAETLLDLCFVEHGHEVTRDLIAAEEAYEEARARARKFGPNEWDQESDFVTDEYDGYPLSWENDGIAMAPEDFIKSWLEDIPDVEVPPDLDLADLASGAGQEFGQENLEDVEVCDIRSAQLSDAWSSYDCSRNRKRIDRWRAMTGRDR